MGSNEQEQGHGSRRAGGVEPTTAERLADEARAYLDCQDAADAAKRERGEQPARVIEADRLARLRRARVHRQHVHSHTDADRRAYREQQRAEAEAEQHDERARLAGLNVQHVSPQTYREHPYGVCTSDLRTLALAKTPESAAEVARKLLALPGSSSGPLVLYVYRVDEDGRPTGRALATVYQQDGRR